MSSLDDSLPTQEKSNKRYFTADACENSRTLKAHFFMLHRKTLFTINKCHTAISKLRFQ